MRIPCPQRGPAVALGLADPDGSVRDDVGLYLGDIGADVVTILPQLCAAVGNPKWDNVNDTLMEKHGMGDYFTSVGIDRRAFLLDSIAKLGPAAEPAIPTLAKLLSDKNDGVRHSAIDALVAVGPAATDALKKATRHRDPVVRETAEEGLKEMREAK
jgi:HEAT repeat protein